MMHKLLNNIITKQRNVSLLKHLNTTKIRYNNINNNHNIKSHEQNINTNDFINELKRPHPNNNIASSIMDKIGRKLHLQNHHPLNIIKIIIQKYCNDYAIKHGNYSFQLYDDINPIVDTKSCFDDLRVDKDHVSRKPSDTYYVNDEYVLRTHTSAHQTHFISSGISAFLCSGDVYRRDEIDSSHYPIFHQMEGVRIFDDKDFPKDISIKEAKQIIEDDLKNILTGLAKHLFGDVEMRWRNDYFPFTEPSFELEILFNGDWLEVLGCGVIHDDVMKNSGKPNRLGWAFGLGLERLAMVLFSIPDIRLFWSTDERFISQFKSGQITKFIPYSKYPHCYKDVSFWLPNEGLHVNDVYELIRNFAGDIVERVELFDQFTNKKTGKQSHAYRITYRHMDKSLTNEEVDAVQFKLRTELVSKLKVELR